MAVLLFEITLIEKGIYMKNHQLIDRSIANSRLVKPELAREVLRDHEISLSIEDPRSPERFVTELLVLINEVEAASQDR